MHADLIVMARRAVDRGTLDPTDLELLPSMADDDALLDLLERLAGPEPQSCSWCTFRRRPGRFDYCAGPRSDLPLVLRFLRQMPVDRGQSCHVFETDHGGRS
jgi:hypothetical protein